MYVKHTYPCKYGNPPHPGILITLRVSDFWLHDMKRDTPISPVLLLIIEIQRSSVVG